MTPAQLAVLKADILADPAFAGLPNNSDANFAIAAAYNAQASPAFVVWRSLVTEHEITDTTSPEATTFSWTAYIARSAAEQNAWSRMFNSTYSVNPSLPQVRQGFADIFSGPSGATMRTHLLAIGKRNATRAEKLFATGTGTTVSPATMGFEGAVTYQQVETARNLP